MRSPLQRFLLPQQGGATWVYDSMNMDGFGQQLADFATPATMKDISFNGNDLSGVSGHIPFYRTNTLQQKHTLVFDSSKCMKGPIISYAGELTIFLLIEADIAFTSAAGNIISYGAGGGISIGNGSVDFTKARFSCNGVGNFETTTSGILVNGQFLVLICQLRTDGSNWFVDFWKNYNFIETVSAAAPISSSDYFTLGALNSSSISGGWVGQFGFGAAFNSALYRDQPSIFYQLQKTFCVRGGLAS